MEEDWIRGVCNEIAQHKPDVVVTEKGLSDLALHFLTKAGISAIRRLRKTDNNRIARATGATIVHRSAAWGLAARQHSGMGSVHRSRVMANDIPGPALHVCGLIVLASLEPRLCTSQLPGVLQLCSTSARMPLASCKPCALTSPVLPFGCLAAEVCSCPSLCTGPVLVGRCVATCAD